MKRQRGTSDVRGGESPVREKRCWNAATGGRGREGRKRRRSDEERERGARRRTRGERRTSDEETKKERIELLPTQRLSYLMIYSAVPESR